MAIDGVKKRMPLLCAVLLIKKPFFLFLQEPQLILVNNLGYSGELVNWRRQLSAYK